MYACWYWKSVSLESQLPVDGFAPCSYAQRKKLIKKKCVKISKMLFCTCLCVYISPTFAGLLYNNYVEVFWFVSVRPALFVSFSIILFAYDYLFCCWFFIFHFICAVPVHCFIFVWIINSGWFCGYHDCAVITQFIYTHRVLTHFFGRHCRYRYGRAVGMLLLLTFSCMFFFFFFIRQLFFM